MTATSTPLNEIASRAVSPPQSWRDPSTHYIQALTHPWYRGVVRLQDAVSRLTADFWTNRGGRTMHLPVTTGSISSPMGLGSDSSPVRVEIGGVGTYLADSMQFMLEFGLRLSPDGAYYVMPSFRGEDSDATHLCQFFHSEAEIVGGLSEIQATVQDYLRYVTAGILSSESEVLASIGTGDAHLRDLVAKTSPFTSITFDEAVKIVGDTPDMVEHLELEAGPARSLTRAAERAVMQSLGEFTWVSHMDHLSVPFYQAFGDEHRRTSLSADLLFGVGETVGAGERHTDAESAREALALHRVSEGEYDWYLRMRELEPLRTAGFGMGVERYLLWVLGHDDIRDLSLLIRSNGEDILP